MNKVLMYEGPFGRMVQMLKRVSVFSCGCTCVGVPLLSAFGNDDMSFTQRVSVGFTVCCFAIGTTGALTMVSKPYVWRMYQLANKNKSLQIETCNLFGRIRVTTLENGLKDVIPCPEGIFVNMGTATGNNFYIHEERDCFADQVFYNDLLNRANIKILSKE
mmetsp:Transcript_9507/g.15133  ORF Transcript_9507/g.15133 Transcript_9507/m.15133 type:complete len:161 (+) Transcript_9507:109-591(+)